MGAVQSDYVPPMELVTNVWQSVIGGAGAGAGMRFERTLCEDGGFVKVQLYLLYLRWAIFKKLTSVSEKHGGVPSTPANLLPAYVTITSRAAGTTAPDPLYSFIIFFCSASALGLLRAAPQARLCARKLLQVWGDDGLVFRVCDRGKGVKGIHRVQGIGYRVGHMV